MFSNSINIHLECSSCHTFHEQPKKKNLIQFPYFEPNFHLRTFLAIVCLCTSEFPKQISPPSHPPPPQTIIVIIAKDAAIFRPKAPIVFFLFFPKKRLAEVVEI